ncbi:MAG: glycosyltransferase family 4 protein [Granulosicoccus sp.]
MTTRDTLHFIIPGDINTRTGGYRYDKRIVQGLEETGWTVHLHSLAGDYPFPSKTERDQASNVLSGIDNNSLVVMDGLAFSTLPEVVKAHSPRLDFIALVHHPLALETGLTERQANSLKRQEIQALSLARHIITTSHPTADSLTHYRVPETRVTAVLPGTDRGKVSSGSGQAQLNLACVATLTPRKGHSVLLEALLPLLKHPWHLYCAGSTERHAETRQRVNTLLEQHELHDRVTFTGELEDDELAALYERTDIFVLASFYEGYGMVLDEAIAHGLPIICTTGGALKTTLPKGAGILVPPHDADALSGAIETLVTDHDQRKLLSDNARKARECLRTWHSATAEFANVLCS